MTVENIGLVDLVDGNLVDTPPTGFSYVEGSMSVRDADGAFALAPGHHPLRIGGLDIAAGEDATIVYLLRVGAGVRLQPRQRGGGRGRERQPDLQRGDCRSDARW